MANNVTVSLVSNYQHNWTLHIRAEKLWAEAEFYQIQSHSYTEFFVGCIIYSQAETCLFDMVSPTSVLQTDIVIFEFPEQSGPGGYRPSYLLSVNLFCPAMIPYLLYSSSLVSV